MRFLFKSVTEKIGPLSHLNGFHLFPRDSIRKTFMHNPFFEYSDTLLFALLACTILYINGKQFRCNVFTCSVYILKNTDLEIGVSDVYLCLIKKISPPIFIALFYLKKEND